MFSNNKLSVCLSGHDVAAMTCTRLTVKSIIHCQRLQRICIGSHTLAIIYICEVVHHTPNPEKRTGNSVQIMRLYILTLVLSVLIISVDAILPRQPPLPNEPPLLGNTSVLPAGWTTVTPINCLAYVTVLELCRRRQFNAKLLPCSDCGGDDFLLGPSFSDPVGLTIESCVAFCDQQGNRIAGLKGALCREPSEVDFCKYLIGMRRICR